MKNKEYKELKHRMGKRKVSKKQAMLRSGIEAVVYIAVVWCGAMLLVKYVVQRTLVEGISMQETLDDGDNLLVDKLIYRYTDPERYDIIVFPNYDEGRGEEILLIKRIVGMPGDRIQIKDGKLLVNGVPLKNDPRGSISLTYAGIAEQPFVLGEDEYFVMGDNRNNSRDSRYLSVGPVKRSDIVGKAAIRMTPISKIGRVE